MKVIVAGSRSILNQTTVDAAIVNSEFEPTEIVSGHAKGVDQCGEAWAVAQAIPYKVFPADWSRWGKQAGFKRNEQMADYANALVAVCERSSGRMGRSEQWHSAHD